MGNCTSGKSKECRQDEDDGPYVPVPDAHTAAERADVRGPCPLPRLQSNQAESSESTSDEITVQMDMPQCNELSASSEETYIEPNAIPRHRIQKNKQQDKSNNLQSSTPFDELYEEPSDSSGASNATSSTQSSSISRGYLHADKDISLQPHDIQLQKVKKQKQRRFKAIYITQGEIHETNLTPELIKNFIAQLIGMEDTYDFPILDEYGKKLYVDIYIDCLQLIDRQDQSLQRSEPLKDILKWGVGGPADRYFAYVAKDKRTDKQMCHILESESQAQVIANVLRETFNQTLPVGSYEQNESLCTTEPLDTPNAHAAVTYTNTEEYLDDMYINIPMNTTNSGEGSSEQTFYLGCEEVSRHPGNVVINDAVKKLLESTPIERWGPVDVMLTDTSLTVFDKYDEKIVYVKTEVSHLLYSGIWHEDIKLCYVVVKEDYKCLVHVIKCQQSSQAFVDRIRNVCKRYSEISQSHDGGDSQYDTFDSDNNSAASYADGFSVKISEQTGVKPVPAPRNRKVSSSAAQLKETESVSIKPGTKEEERESDSYCYVAQDHSPPNLHSTVQLPAEITSYSNRSEQAQMVLADRGLIEDTILVADVIPHLPLLEDTEEILLKAKESSKRAAFLLLEKMLKSTDEGKWTSFVTALQKEEYSYLVDSVKGGDIDVAKIYTDRKLLKLFHSLLKKDMIPDELLDILYQDHIITSSDVNEIRQELKNSGRDAGNYMLLDRIPRRQLGWLETFKSALRRTDQAFLADEIEGKQNCSEDSNACSPADMHTISRSETAKITKREENILDLEAQIAALKKQEHDMLQRKEEKLKRERSFMKKRVANLADEDSLLMVEKRSGLDIIKESDVPDEKQDTFSTTDNSLWQGLIKSTKTTLRIPEDSHLDLDYNFTESTGMVKIFDARQSNIMSMRYRPFEGLKF